MPQFPEKSAKCKRLQGEFHVLTPNRGDCRRLAPSGGAHEQVSGKACSPMSVLWCVQAPTGRRSCWFFFHGCRNARAHNCTLVKSKVTGGPGDTELEVVRAFANWETRRERRSLHRAAGQREQVVNRSPHRCTRHFMSNRWIFQRHGVRCNLTSF